MSITDVTRAGQAARVAQAAQAAQVGRAVRAADATLKAGTAASATGAGRGGAAAAADEAAMARKGPGAKDSLDIAEPKDDKKQKGNAVQRFFDGMIAGAGKWGGKLVDGAVDLATAPVALLAKATKDVPVLGSVTRAMEWTQRQTLGLGAGVLKGAGTMVEGIATMVVHPVETVKGLYAMASHVPLLPANPLKLISAGYDVVANGKSASAAFGPVLNPLESIKEDGAFWKAAGGALLAPYDDAMKQGRYGEMAGRAIFDIGSLFIGAGEVNAVLKGGAAAGRAAEVVSTAGKVAGVADDAARAAKAAGVADDAARAARAAGVADEAGKVGGAVSALDNLGQVADDAGKVVQAAEAAGSGARFMGGRIAEGAEITVRRSSGAVESGWKVVAERPDGRLLARKDGMLKPISPEELVRLNPKAVDLPQGAAITVRRSSGALEDGWRIAGRGDDGRVIVVKDIPGQGQMTKHISPREVLEANPELAAVKPTAQVAQAGARAARGVDEVVDAMLRDKPLSELQANRALGRSIYSDYYNPSGATKPARITQEAYAEAVGGARGIKQLPDGGVAINDGYWHRRMSATGDITQSQAINRFYFNVKPDSAIGLADHLSGELNRLGIPHQFKMPTSLDNFNRMDAGVLYVDKAHVAQVQGVIDDFIRKAPGALDEGAPAFTKPVRKGVAWAEEPTGNLPPARAHSFGTSRADIIAEGIQSAPPGASPAQVKELVRERFRHYGLDPDQPWSNAR